MRYKTRENSSERQHTGNASRAAQDRILSSRDRDIKSNASMVSTGGRQKLRQRSSQENRRSGGVTSNPSESPRHWPQEQGNKVKSRPGTSKLGQLKGGGKGNELNKKEVYYPGKDKLIAGSEVAQVSTQRSRELLSRDKGFSLAAQRWRVTRGDSSVTSRPSKSSRHWLQNQGNEVKFRPNDRKFNTSKLGQLKGGGEEETTEQIPRWEEPLEEPSTVIPVSDIEVRSKKGSLALWLDSWISASGGYGSTAGYTLWAMGGGSGLI